ncbi:transposase family protein [Streptomyces violaceusniger]|uniref:transposase family protein n=1 Tax=Streptomyces violaceusniger TaxID=68280 RepID=UPI003431AB41
MTAAIAAPRSSSPHWPREDRPLTPEQQADNTAHRRARARVEHAFSRMKTYKVLRGCRLRGDGVHHAVLGVARLHSLALAG